MHTAQPLQSQASLRRRDGVSVWRLDIVRNPQKHTVQLSSMSAEGHCCCYFNLMTNTICNNAE